MRRKLIKQDAFDRITNESVTTAERELVEAESILAKALGRDHLNLHCFTESTAVYKTLDKSYVHAGYEIKNNEIVFNNIEELVIDESSRKAKQRECLSEMIDLVLTSDDSNNNHARAEEQFKNYLGMVRWDEAKGEFPFKKKDEKKTKGFPFGKKKDEDEEDDNKKGGFPFGKKKDKKEDDKKGFPFGKKKSKKDHDEDKKNHFFGKAKKAGKEVAEAYVTANNVLDYVEFMKVGPTLAEAVSKIDEKGNVTDIKFPTLKPRLESKLYRTDWRTLNSKVAESRKLVPSLVENQEFCKAVADLKRQNAFADADGLNEALDHVVKHWPVVLFSTQSELSQVIGECLAAVGANNFDDTVCEQMAEGILRRAHGAYSEKVSQILHLASAPKMEANADAYKFFQFVTESFYPALDEKFGLERQVFADLYESLGVVYKKADRQGDNALKSEAASYINEVAAILNGELKPDLEVAEEAASWMQNIIETNLDMGTWVVSNTPHLTVNGDHPDMAKKAGHGYTPSKDFSGNWGDSLPAIGQDNNNYKNGKNAKNMRNDSWGQAGPAGDMFPKLKNPYTPKPFGDYTMKGEKGVDKDNKDWSLWSSGDTWPALNNPYVPKEKVGTAGKGYKMKNGKETDLVVDR